MSQNLIYTSSPYNYYKAKCMCFPVSQNSQEQPRGPSSDVEISAAIGPERGGLQICDLTRN